MLAAAALVLFDIDGTLLRGAGPHHKLALVEGVRRVTGYQGSLDRVGTHGMLDRDLLGILLLDAGLSKLRIREVMPVTMRQAEQAYLNPLHSHWLTDSARACCRYSNSFSKRDVVLVSFPATSPLSVGESSTSPQFAATSPSAHSPNRKPPAR